MPRTVSLPSQEELGCGSHTPVAVRSSTGTSFMATGRKPAYPGKDVGRWSHIESSWQVRRLLPSSQ